MEEKAKVRSTKAVVDKRIKEIVCFYKQGHTRSFVYEHAEKNKWDLSPSRMDHLITEANKIILEHNQAAMEHNLALIASNYWDLYRLALVPSANTGELNLGEARQVLTALAKLHGLDKQIISHVVDDRRETKDLSDEELDAVADDVLNKD